MLKSVKGSRVARCSCCFIVPPDLLKQLSQDEQLGAEERSSYETTYAETKRLTKLRDTNRIMSLQRTGSETFEAAVATGPNIVAFDCQNRQSLPGIFVADPANSADEAVRNVHQATTAVAKFYKDVFGRNSLDGAGIDLVSSLHYLKLFRNAFWDGRQMVYGDGDGQIFTGFHKSPDVIGHELTHGVTQYESGLVYEGEAGALNESISDVFGATFNQWLNGWEAGDARGWLIGAGIMGPRAAQAGKTCLRDMADPAGGHCLSLQPASYRDFNRAADVHINSGIPNKAFSDFARNVGGRSWDRAAPVWYAACTDGMLPSTATFVDFARRTVVAANAVGLAADVTAAWEGVDVPVSGEA